MTRKLVCQKESEDRWLIGRSQLPKKKDIYPVGIKTLKEVEA